MLKKVPPGSEVAETITARINEAKSWLVANNLCREKIFFGIIGILLGFIVGFMFASSMSQKTQQAQLASAGQSLPADHPPVGAQNPSGNPEEVRAQVTESLEKARNEPKNFEAQVKAADSTTRSGYDQAIEFLLKGEPVESPPTTARSWFSAW